MFQTKSPASSGERRTRVAAQATLAQATQFTPTSYVSFDAPDIEENTAVNAVSFAVSHQRVAPLKKLRSCIEMNTTLGVGSQLIRAGQKGHARGRTGRQAPALAQRMAWGQMELRVKMYSAVASARFRKNKKS